MTTPTKKDIQLTEKDKQRYYKEIEKIDLKDKSEILKKVEYKLNDLLKDPNLEEVQLVLVQEINSLRKILLTKPELENSIQRKILFAISYFLNSDDDIPDYLPEIGYVDDIALVEWIIGDIKDQYSEYYQA